MYRVCISSVYRGDDEFLYESLMSVYNCVDEIHITYYENPDLIDLIPDEYKPPMTNTLDVLMNILDEDIMQKVWLYIINDNNVYSQYDIYIMTIRHLLESGRTGYCFILDVDEVWEESVLDNCFNYMEIHDKGYGLCNGYEYITPLSYIIGIKELRFFKLSKEKKYINAPKYFRDTRRRGFFYKERDDIADFGLCYHHYKFLKNKRLLNYREIVKLVRYGGLSVDDAIQRVKYKPFIFTRKFRIDYDFHPDIVRDKIRSIDLNDFIMYVNVVDTQEALFFLLLVMIPFIV